ncbi:pre-tRNA nuclear export protein [Pichia californica]|nr:pre-tRNA nuclear export protein [[Candida] californica]
MEAQIQQAVDIANNPSSDQILKDQALSFITQIKSSDEGWEHCLKILQLDSSNSNVKFFAFQVINEKLFYLSNDNKLNVKNIIFQYLNNLISLNKIEPFFLRNALSKTLGLIFVNCTLNCYSTLIKDLLNLSYNSNNNSFNEIATDYLIRTLLVIHQEIGDQSITRDNSIQDHNNLLKDAIRATDMIDLTNIWKLILSKFDESNSKLGNEIINNTIICIGSFISWIEINLILDDQYMLYLYKFLSSNENSKRRIVTATTFNEILHKKMSSTKKLELINFLNLGSILNQLNLNSKIMEFDVAMSLSKLINQIGIESLIVLETASTDELSNNEFKNLVSSKILEIFPLIFNFLSNEFDDISLEVFPFIGNFLLFLKKNITNENLNLPLLNNDDLLTSLSENIILKLKFDPDDDGDDDETIEQFNEIRNKLNVFLDSIVLLNETLALDVIINCINKFLFSKINIDNNNNNNKDNEDDWRTIELGLYVLTYYSDMLRNNIMNLPKTMINNSRPYFVFNEMLCKVINNSNQILINHPLIQLLFFELLLKHYPFFTNNNIQVENVNKDDTLMKVLNIFISNFGVFSSNEKVKYRSWYLLYRFLKLTKPKINDYIIEELIKSLLPLLNFNNFEVILNKNKNNNKSLTNSIESSLNDLDLSLIEETGSFENQLYLFESVGLLITFINNEDLKLSIFENVLQPLFLNLENGITSNSNLNLNLNILIQVHHSLISIGNLLKGFENIKIEFLNNIKFLNIINQISQVIMITVENFINFNIIREAIQFCIVRSYIILNGNNNNNNDNVKELLQDILSKFISCIMINFDKLKINEIINFINFISQILHQINNNNNNSTQDSNTYLLLQSLLSPLLNKIFYKIETELNNVTDEFIKRDLLDLQRSVLSMIIAISNDHLNSLWLTNNENKETLVNTIKMVLNYASNYSTTDLSIVKLSILILNMFCQGIGSGIVLDPNDKFKNDNNKFELVDDILINNSILLSIELGIKVPAANKNLLKDAQFRNNVTLETCRLLKGIAHIGFEYPDANTLQKKKSDANNTTTVLANKDKVLPTGFNEIKCQQISNVLINNFGFPMDLSNEIVQSLVANTDRQFLKYLVALVEKF